MILFEIELLLTRQLAQLLNNEARERLSRIRIVREDRARAVEQLLVRMARSGQISRKLTEPELVSLLEQIKGPSGPKIVYNRRGDEDQPIVEENSNKDDSEDDFFD